MSQPHAALKITVGSEILNDTSQLATCEIEGCEGCLIQALTMLLLTDTKMKNVLNKAIRKANEIKASKQN